VCIQDDHVLCMDDSWAWDDKWQHFVEM
jgi:hypothetical protein